MAIANGKAVIFGAGNIGRGFLAQLFHESGLEVVFIDVVEPIIRAINTQGSYSIHIVGKGAANIIIDQIRAINVHDGDTVASEVAGATILATAVGARALPFIIEPIRRGLQIRMKNGGGPLNIIIAENLHGAADVFRGYLRGEEKGEPEWLKVTGTAHAVVSRMVPIQTEDERLADPLAVRVEAYKRLPIDGAAVVGDLPPLVGVEPVMNFKAHEARKLYIHNCGHALIGYLGAHRGHVYGYTALEDPCVRITLDRALSAVSEALIIRYGFEESEQRAHVDDLLERFANRELGDTVQRLARDPIRKLRAEDRIVGAARLVESTGVKMEGLPFGIAAALLYRDPDDPSAMELQGKINDNGVEETMNEICEIKPEEPLGSAVLSAYEQLQTGNFGIS